MTEKLKTPDRDQTREEAQRIIKERTPDPEKVIYAETVEYLDPGGELTREEQARVVTAGDRTAESYWSIKDAVIASRAQDPVEIEGELVDATTAFLLRYSLKARGAKEISHDSPLEQVDAGNKPETTNSPIVGEGLLTYPALRFIADLDFFSFEIFSSRGGIYPEGYFRVPQALVEAGLGPTLESINREVYSIYMHLAEKGVEYYLQNLSKQEGEKNWQYKWRVLSHSLDLARQVTNQTFLVHLSIHPNNALAIRQALVQLSSHPLPEVQDFATKLRELARRGIPNLMRYTEASPYREGLPQKRKAITQELGLKPDHPARPEEKPRFISHQIIDDPERVFLAAFLANEGDLGFEEALIKLRSVPKARLGPFIAKVFEGISLHDKLPQELAMVRMRGNFILSVGAVYEAIRHRLATHIYPRFTIHYGYSVPQLYKEIGLEDVYRRAMSLNERGYRLIEELGSGYEVFLPYFVGRAHLVPSTIDMSLWDGFHFLKLRADESAHADIRDPMTEFEKFLREDTGSIFRHVVKKNGGS